VGKERGVLDLNLSKRYLKLHVIHLPAFLLFMRAGYMARNWTA